MPMSPHRRGIRLRWHSGPPHPPGPDHATHPAHRREVSSECLAIFALDLVLRFCTRTRIEICELQLVLSVSLVTLLRLPPPFPPRPMRAQQPGCSSAGMPMRACSEGPGPVGVGIRGNFELAQLRQAKNPFPPGPARGPPSWSPAIAVISQPQGPWPSFCGDCYA